LVGRQRGWVQGVTYFGGCIPGAVRATIAAGSIVRKIAKIFGELFMLFRPRILSPLIVPLLVSPILAADYTYVEYAKAPEIWKRGFVFGISRYMTAVAQPDEEPPYPTRTGFQRCFGTATDTFLVQRVQAYVAANRGEFSKTKPTAATPSHR